MIRSVLLFLVLFFAAGPWLKGQDCAVKLREAENSFSQGRVEEVPGLLESCLESGFTREEELSAYKLIIRSYLFDDKTELAEQTMLEFLKRRPEYEISPTDNADFIYLLNQYRVRPVIQVGVHGGGLMTYVTGIGNEGNRQSTSSIPVKPDYTNDQLTFTLGLDIRFKLGEKFELGIEADYSEISYRYNEDYLNFGLVDYFEKQQKIEASFMGYCVPKVFGRFSPYLKLGSGVGYNLATNANPLFEPIDVNNPAKRTGAAANRLSARIPLDAFIHPGAGVKFKLPSSYIFVDISSHISLRFQSFAANPDNEEYYYLYTDDRFVLNTLRFSAGYIFIFYKPEKLEE